jgi:lipid-A-disaccharide synthase
MVNLLAGRAVVPELLQQACTPEKLRVVVRDLLTDTDIAGRQKAAFTSIVSSLRAPHGLPAEEAAAAVLEAIAGKRL